MNRFLITSIIQIGLGLLVAKILNTTDLTVYFATAYLLANWHYCSLSTVVNEVLNKAEGKQ